MRSTFPLLVAAAAAPVALAGLVGAQDLVLNGSFEQTSEGGCVFNLDNPDVEGALEHVYGIGTAEELDLTQGPPACDWGIVPADGVFKVGLHCQPMGGLPTDAISLALQSPILAGEALDLSFSIAGKEPGNLAPLQFGLSADPYEFGVVVASVAPTGVDAWETHTINLSAPVDAEYLTVRQSASADAYTFLDEVELRPALCGLVVAATEVKRLGVPPNPPALKFGQTSGPVLGHVWDPVIDHTTFVPNADLDFIAVSGSATNYPSPMGTILCGVAPFLVDGGVPGVPAAFAIPAECTLVGQPVVAQGGSREPNGAFHLTNAIDAVIGTY